MRLNKSVISTALEEAGLLFCIELVNQLKGWPILHSRVGIFTEGWNWTLRCLEKPLQKRIATYRFVNSVLIIRRKWCAECSNVFPEPAKFVLSIRTQARPGRAVRTFGSFLLTSIAPGITRNGSWSTAPEAVSQPINGGAACFCSYKRDPLYAWKGVLPQFWGLLSL